jgi:hypothetical protein
MTQLSPAAQVMIAVTHVYQDHGGDPPARAITAAALRAAADQVVPESRVYRPTSDGTMRCENDLWITRRVLYAIAAELEAQ